MADYMESVAKYMDAWNTDDPDERLRLLRESWVEDGEWLVSVLEAPLVGPERIAAFIGDAIALTGFAGHRTEVVGEVPEHNSCALVSWRTTAPDGSLTLAGQNFFEFDDGLIRRMVGFFRLADPATDG